MTAVTSSSRRGVPLRRIAGYGVPVLVAIVLLIAADSMRLATANQLTSLLLLAALALAWNLVSGFGGQFSLGHSIFVGVGGYATAIAFDYSELPLVVILIASGTVAAIIGVVLAYPMLRLRGPYFAIGTLGIALAVLGWMLNWDFTRASRGYPIPSEALLDLSTLFRVVVITTLGSFLIIRLIMDSPLGLRLLALRDNEDGAISLGVRRLRTLVPAWAISAFLAGIAGALIAVQNGNLTPNSAFSIQYTLDVVVICVIGGLGTLYGPLVGAVLVFVLRQFTADFAGWGTAIEAIVVILVVRFFPNGALGAATRVIEFARRVVRRRVAARKEGDPADV